MRMWSLTVLAGVLAACGSATTSTAPAPLGSPPAGAVVESPHSAQPHPIGASPRPLSTETPTPDAHHELKSVPWTLNAKQDSGRKLLITYNAGGCATDAGVHVTETSAYVMLAAYNLVPKPSGEPMACPAIALVVFGTVELAEPLGDRTLYHAPVQSG